MTRETAGSVMVTAGISTADERAYRRLVALLTVLVAVWTVAWAVLTPPLRSPDEQNHINSVLRLAYGGGWPAPGDAQFAPVMEQAVEESSYPADLPGRYHQRPDVPDFVDAEPVPRQDRARVDASNAVAGPGSDAEVDQMTQHPPAYYAVGAVFLHATGLTEARWDVVMLALRLLDVVLFAAAIPFAAAAVRRVTGSRAAALVAAPLPLLIPQVGHIMGSVNNDVLVVLVCTVATWLCARVVTGDVQWRTAAALGAVLGVGMLTKVMVAFAVPMVVASYLLAPGTRWRVRLGRLVAAGLVAVVVGGWWWLRNLLVLGVVQPTGRPRDLSTLATVADDEALSLSVGGVAQSFFGNLSWLEVRIDGTFVVVGTVVLVASALVALTLPGARRACAALLLLPAGLWAGVVYNALDYHAETHRLVALQGRYVFGGLAALMLAVAVAVWQLLRRSERRTAVAVPVSCTAAVAVAVACLWWGFTGMYRGPGDTVTQAIDRWLAWSPLPAPWLGAVLVAATVVAVAAVVGTVRWAVRTASGEVRGLPQAVRLPERKEDARS